VEVEPAVSLGHVERRDTAWSWGRLGHSEDGYAGPSPNEMPTSLARLPPGVRGHFADGERGVVAAGAVAAVADVGLV
jgi:hypothetical protein